MRETYRMAMHRAARDYFTALLRECNGNVEHAATRAGVNVVTVYQYVRRTKIKEIRGACKASEVM